MLSEIIDVMWISKIPLSKETEKNIRDCFFEEDMNFKYPDIKILKICWKNIYREKKHLVTKMI